ncbi:MAG: hypothetical protein ACMXYL_00765 [Candidatus Woesearchaeota archaeon]
MRVRNTVIAVLVLMLVISSVIVFARPKDGSSAPSFFRDKWENTAHDIARENLVKIVVEGNVFDTPPDDDHITSLRIRLGKAEEGICVCSGGEVVVSGYYCFDDEHAICNNDNCLCRKNTTYCRGGVIEKPAGGCSADADPVYDPSYPGTGYNACCMPESVGPPPENGGPSDNCRDDPSICTGSTPYCRLSDETCVECRNDADCVSGRPHCSNGECRLCLTNSHCPPGYKCEDNTGDCIPITCEDYGLLTCPDGYQCVDELWKCAE